MKHILLISMVLVLASNCTRGGKPTSPNIVLILADDLGYGGLSSYGNDSIYTPNLDKLSQFGIRFTDFHSNGSVCTPTRAALLTGQYQQRAGLEGVIYVKGQTRQMGLDLQTTTLAEVLKENGYRTGIMGKWHLGYQSIFNPTYHGFEEFFGYVSGNIDYHTHYDNAGIYDWYHNLDSIKEKGYVTDLITKHALDFISVHHHEPFFLYVAHEAPHVPFQGRKDPGYRTAKGQFSYLGPVTDRHRAYREMVEVMDESTGAIFQKLEDLELLENTLIFFLSDNGGLKGYGHNGSLRGAKTQLWEGGHRVPAIAYWKNHISPAVSDEPLMTIDLFPTLLSVCHIKAPDDWTLDGIDFSPVWSAAPFVNDRFLFWRYRGQKAVRRGDLKLMIDQKDTFLFKMNQDMQEAKNLFGTVPNEEARLLDALKKWEKEMDQTPQKTT